MSNSRDFVRSLKQGLFLGMSLFVIAGCNSSFEIPGGKPVDVAAFGNELAAEELALVKFGATWCGPCRQIDKELESLDAQQLGIKIIKVDIDEQPELASQFNISGIPHLVLVRNGQTVRESKGYQTAEQLTDWIKSNQ